LLARRLADTVRPMLEMDWPPPIGARVRDGNGDEFDVIAHQGERSLGEVAVIRRSVPGRQTRPVSYVAWNRCAGAVVRQPSLGEAAARPSVQ